MSSRMLSLAPAALAVLTAWATASAAPAWPASNNLWTPVEVGGAVYPDQPWTGGNAYGDVYNTTPNPNYTDIVGGVDQSANGPFAGLFWYQDGTHLMFRMRVDGQPSVNPQTVWQALIESTGDTTIDWSVQLDLSSADDQVELVPALSGGPDNGWNVVLADPPHTGAGSPATDFYRFVDATAGGLDAPYGGSQFTGDGDWFVDFAFPVSVFEATTGLDVTTFDFTNRTAATTSATHTLTNKDTPDFTNREPPVGAPPDVPEPATMALTALGCAALLGYRRRR